MHEFKINQLILNDLIEQEEDDYNETIEFYNSHQKIILYNIENEYPERLLYDVLKNAEYIIIDDVHFDLSNLELPCLKMKIKNSFTDSTTNYLPKKMPYLQKLKCEDSNLYFIF